MNRIARFASSIILGTALTVIVATPADASLCKLLPILCDRPVGGGGGGNPVPEIDPRLLGGALTIVAGGIALLADRRGSR